MMNYLLYVAHTKPQFKSKLLSLCAALLAFLPYQTGSYAKLSPENPYKMIAITQIVEHPSLDLIRQGIIDELKDHGYIKGKNLQIYYENAQGNIVTAAQIAQKFVGLNPNVIIAITTPSAQTVMKADQTKQIPIVFSAITDPLGANLVTSLEKPGGFATGVIDLPPIEGQILLIKKIIPHIKRIGVVYNPGETNNVTQIQSFKKHANALGITVVESHASKSSDVYAATKHLIHNVQAIYIANDNTVVSALEALLKVTNEYQIPVFASDGQSVARGAVLALANNQYEVGKDTGKLVLKILRGAKPGDLSVLSSKKTELYINEAAAKACRLKIPPGLSQ